MQVRRNFARVHIWIGWLVGIPLLLWTGSGLFMVMWPIETVRGEHLRRAPVALTLTGQPVLPQTGNVPIKSLSLEARPEGARWIVVFQNGAQRLADPRDGALLPPLTQMMAARAARNAYTGSATIKTLSRSDAQSPPLDLRRARPAWQASFDDGTRVYIDAETGAVLAVRTELWRWFDLMWGIHIMDLQTREDSHHPLLVSFAALAFVSVLIGLILLPMRRKKAR